MLETAEFDVLLILDCCYAAGAITKGPTSTMEVLAGCSRESKAGGPGASSIISSPFTHTLIRHLEESATEPHGLLITELYTLLSLDKVLKNQSPIHVLLSGYYNPIKLRPLLPETELKETENSISQTVKPGLKALVAISFRENALPEVEEFVQWLNSQYPKEIAEVEVERVSIKGSFDGCSTTLILLSMPISMWAYLGGSYGSSLIGFVKSTNLLADGSKLRMTQLEMEMAKMVSMTREEREKAREAREREKKKGEEAQSEMAKMVSMMREERDKAREERDKAREAMEKGEKAREAMEKEEEAREKEKKKKKERKLGQRWRKWPWRSENEGE
jgi:hypothetical protein